MSQSSENQPLTSPIDCIRRDRVTELVLNRPQAGNAFDAALVEALHAALDGIDDAACDTIVFRGTGKGFCGGLDLSAMADETDGSLLWRLVRIELLLQRVANAPQQTVALAHGFAFGTGADLFVACARRIAAPGTRFSFPGVRFGIALGTGRLGRSVGAAAARRILSATTAHTAEELQACGLVEELSDPAAWPDIVAALADAPCALDARMKAIVAERLAAGMDDADLAALVRSGSLPGLKARIAAYASAVAAGRRR